MSRSRILVAVSSPWAGQKLAEPIIDLAKRLDAEAIVAHVAKLRDEDESEADAKRRGEETLKMLTQSLLDGGVEAQGVMLFSDDIAKALLNTAKARECSLIVLGLSSKGVLQRLIAGDVPGNIIRQTEVPILLLPANWGGHL